MAIKTFAVGEVLTASDTNTYLANSGLVHIATVSWSAATQVDFLNVFSSTYTNYRVVFDNWTATVSENHLFRVRDSGGILTGASYITQRLEQTSTTVSGVLVGGGASSAWFPTYIGTGAGAEGVAGVMDIYQPNVAGYTRTTGQFSRWDAAAGYSVQFSGLYNATTVLTGFSLVRNSTATMTGKASVYGYRIS